MLESQFQARLIKKLEKIFPGCVVLITDPEYIQGIPDVIMLWGDQWAALECKKSENATIRPNQPYYVDLLDRMSFAAFIYPENEEEILYDLQQALCA